MRVRCINNSGIALQSFEYNTVEKSMLGRFGATEYTDFCDGGLRIGETYLVMGIIIFETYQGYLIDYGGLPSVVPCQLFEVIDYKVSSNWFYRLIEKGEEIHPFVQAIFGYAELCLDKKAYENVIVEMEEEYQHIYFKRKKELEKEIE